MAEGWAKELCSKEYHFYSAGIEKHGLNPRAVKVMQEVGVDISQNQSKHVDELSKVRIDHVFTVCSAAHETCPFFSGAPITHIGFDDPPQLTKDLVVEEDILNVYRRVRDEIKSFVKNIEKYLK